MYVCMRDYVCLCVCVCICFYLCAFKRECLLVSSNVCKHVIYVCVYVSVYICLYATRNALDGVIV